MPGDCLGFLPSTVCLVEMYGKCVGKYASPTDPMGWMYSILGQLQWLIGGLVRVGGLDVLGSPYERAAVT